MFDNTYKSYKKQLVCYLLLDVIDYGWHELTFHPKCTTITPNNHICNYKLAHAKICIANKNACDLKTHGTTTIIATKLVDLEIKVKSQ